MLNQEKEEKLKIERMKRKSRNPTSKTKRNKIRNYLRIENTEKR